MHSSLKRSSIINYWQKWGALIFNVWRVTILVEEWGASMDEYYLDLTSFTFTSTIINSLLYFHIVSHLSKKEYLPLSVLNINTREIFTGIVIIYTGINSIRITLNW
jgi:hypothetical protein